jgi:ABC-type iron transport system FetAB permease component
MAISVPISGMILGNSISAIGISWSQVLREFTQNKDKIEIYLAMGSTRFEAFRPVGMEALKVALLPTINQMRWVREVVLPATCG